MPSSPSPLTRRLSFRFSLRTLLIFMVVLGLSAAWVGSVCDRVGKQRAIVRVLNAHGAEIYYDYQRESGGLYQQRLPRGNAVLQATVGNDVFAYVDTVSLSKNDDDKVNQQLALLPRLPRLTGLSVAGGTDESLELIARNSQLTELHLSKSRITPAALAHLTALKNLKRLSMYGSEFDDVNLSGLPNLPQLESLQLARTAVTSAGLAPVSKLQNLERLAIYVAPGFTDAGLVHLRELHQLKSLELLETSVADTGLVHLRDLKQLRTLDLRLSPVGDAGMEHLAVLTQLEELNLAATQVGDTGLRQLVPLQRLQSLRLGATKITDQSAPIIGQFRELNYLWIDETALTDTSLPSLQSLTKLKFLKIGPNISQASAAALQSHLPQCEISSGYPGGKNQFQLKAIQQGTP